MAIKFVCLLFVVGLVAQVHAKLDGAPRESCNDMIPQHGTPPQKGASPFVVQVSNTAVRAGEKIKIKIGGSTTFKGFLVQARDANGQKIGTFTATQSNVSKAIQCDSANVSVYYNRFSKCNGPEINYIVLLGFLNPYCRS